MSIQRVPEVPFAQIANGALRDRSLSFKARGILAMVLSNVGEWEATAKWIEQQSEIDGASAVQSGLNELTNAGYRRVFHERNQQGQVRTVTEWFHSSINRSTENPPTGKPDHRETGAALEHHLLEHYLTEHDQTEHKKELVRKPVDPDYRFEEFWQTYPRKESKGTARRAWLKAVRVAAPDRIIAGALRYNDDPNRDPAFTAHAATWLNGERWLDGSLPGRDSRSGLKNAEVMNVIERAALRDMGEIGS